MFGSAEVIIIKHVVKPLLKPCYLFVDRAVKTSTPVFAEVFRDRRQNNNVRRGVKADKEPALIIITSSQRWGGESFLHQAKNVVGFQAKNMVGFQAKNTFGFHAKIWLVFKRKM